MAITNVTQVSKGGQSSAPVFFDEMTFTGDSAYPTGGSAFDALFEAAVGQDRTIMAVLHRSGGYVPEYDAATGKLKLLVTGAASQAALAEVNNNTDLSAKTIGVLVISR